MPDEVAAGSDIDRRRPQATMALVRPLPDDRAPTVGDRGGRLLCPRGDTPHAHTALSLTIGRCDPVVLHQRCAYTSAASDI